MSRQFSHLSQVEIRQLLHAYYIEEKPKLHIAEEMGIDRSTVTYHVRKYENSYPEQGNVYSLIKLDLRKTCTHPSLRCGHCGTWQDAIYREEKQTIRELRKKLTEANRKLVAAGLAVE